MGSRIPFLILYSVLQLQLHAYKPVIYDVQRLLNKTTTNRTYLTGGNTDCKGTEDCWTISVTGHSLGGFIAEIVGSTLGINVI